MSDLSHLVKRMLTALVLLAALAAPCLTGSPLPIHTLEQIASKKSITLGYQDDASPSSWQNDNVPAGYPIDICNSIVGVLKTKLQLRKLKVEWVKTNLVSQFALIKSHMTSIICIPASYSKGCHSTSEFSLPFYFSSTRFVTRKNESNDNLAELSGHSVLVKSGTIYAEQLQKVNAANDPDTNIQFDTNNTTVFNELKNGEYSALISSTVLLKRMIAQTPNPDDYELSDITLSTPLPAGLLLPLHDKEPKEFVDDTLSSLVISDEFTALYKKWSQSPIPPKAINLNISMSSNLKALTPTKKKISSDYEKYN